MTQQMLLTLSVIFVATALFVGAIVWYLATQLAPGRRRLGQVLQPAPGAGILLDNPQLTSAPSPFWERLVTLLPNANKYLRSQLALAGYHSDTAVVVYCVGEFVGPVVVAPLVWMMLAGQAPLLQWFGGFVGLVAGYMAPDFILRARVKRRQKEIQNGLADALDLFVLCLEAGSSLDQAIVKASEELEVAYPALGDQLRILIAETRAGMPRLEAFRNLAKRTKVDDVRALVAMLVQTDRFGTSIAQALRTQANVCRTKRRQNAEERAAKVGVKLVFPLVFFLFPAFYLVMLGPAYMKFLKVLGP